MHNEVLVVTPETSPEDYRAAREKGTDIAAELPAEPEKTEAEAKTPEPAAAEPEKSDGTDAGKDKKETPWYQKRFDELTREKYELRGQLTATQAEIESLRTAGQKPAEEKTPEGRPVAPDIDKFETMDAFFKANNEYAENLAKWTVAEHEKAKAKKEQEAKDAEFVEAYRKRIDAARAKHADFDAIVSKISIPPSHQPALIPSLMEMEAGAEVCYYLGQHPEELAKILAMTPTAAVRQLGKIEDKLAVPVKPAEEKPKSNAPEPITPVGGGGHKPSVELADISDPDEYRRAREKELKANRR